MEKAFSFGKNNSLVGVLNEPGALRNDEHPVIIILNAGLVHHVGPHRMSVDMARSISALGYTTFRFDLSSIGDSANRKSRLSYQDRAVDEIREAMDYLSLLNNSDKYIVIGLCTGADNAHRVAVADKRVIGCVFLAGYSYPTMRFFINKMASKISQLASKAVTPEKWIRLTKKILNRLPDKDGASDNVDETYFWKLPPKEQAAKEYASLISRNVNLYFIFTASEIAVFNYREQIQDSFKQLEFGSLLNVDLFKLTDHTYSFSSQRELLFSSINNWLKNNFHI